MISFEEQINKIKEGITQVWKEITDLHLDRVKYKKMIDDITKWYNDEDAKSRCAPLNVNLNEIQEDMEDLLKRRNELCGEYLKKEFDLKGSLTFKVGEEDVNITDMSDVIDLLLNSGNLFVDPDFASHFLTRE